MILLCLLFFLQLVAPIAIPAVKNASLDGSDEVDGEEDVVSQLVKGPEAEINPTTGQSCHEIHKQHCPSQAEKTCGGEDEHAKACMLQNMPEETQSYVQQQPDLSAATTSRGVTEPAEDYVAMDVNLDSREVREEERHRETEAEEEMKSTLKFCYFSTGISVAGNISIFSGYLGDQTGHAHEVPLKVCSLLMTATFVSGASMLVLILLRYSIRVSIEFFRSLKCTTVMFLILAMLSVSIIFLKMLVILAFIPTVFMVMISIIMARHPWSHYQAHWAVSFRRGSLLPV